MKLRELGIWLNIRKNRWKVILAIIVLIIVIPVLIRIGYNLAWTGFGEYIGPAVPGNQTFQRAKTLWDWMQLLIIPAVLAGGAAAGAYWLNESARKREQAFTEQRAKAERDIAADNRQEIALQTYLDRMAELLIKEKLRESEQDSEVRAVARAQTLTVLRRLDGNRKGALLRFLYEADLIDEDKIVIDLSEADLSEVNLIKANLRGAILSKADLGGANLSEAYMYNVNLYRANLSDANLREAYLGYVNLNQANLSRANLIKADLTEANLSLAKLSEVKYNKDTKWPEDFDPIAAGAIRVNE